jgi:hypothetical protein
MSGETEHRQYDSSGDRDRPLSFHWSAPDLARELGLPPARNVAFETVRASILAEAAMGAETEKAVSYSRRRQFYSNGKRYRDTAYTYATVLPTIAELDRASIIIDRRVAPGNLGWQSSFVATDYLRQAWRNTAQRLTYADTEILWLKDVDGELIDYADSRATRRMRRELAERNETLALLDIRIPGSEWRGRHMLIGDSYVLPIPGNPLRRIFSRGRWSLHGRFYGWWQSIPKTARASMTIDGESVAEADYGSLHASILYNEVGIAFSGDAYDIAGFERAEVKLGFNIAINAKSRRAAVAALDEHLGKGRVYCATLIEAIERRHKLIERYFCSDAGVRLMRIDSDLISAAQTAVNDCGDPALPLHDALIVPARCANRAADKMTECFEQIVGRASPCTVKIKRQNIPHMGETRVFSPGSSSFPIPIAA